MRELHRRKRCKFKSEINIVPLLDVLLVLLLVSMAVSPTIYHKVEVEIPNTSNSQITRNNFHQSIIIEVSGIGRYNILEGNDRRDQLRSDQIISNVRHRLKLNPKTIFLIAGEKNIPYNEIIKIMNLLQSAGVKSVSLMTKPI